MECTEGVEPISRIDYPQTSSPGGFRPVEQPQIAEIELRSAREVLDGIYDEDVGGRRLDRGVLLTPSGKCEVYEKKLHLQAMARSSLYSSLKGKESR